MRRIRTILERSPHSKSLSRELLYDLAQVGRIEHFEDGELIHAAWQPVRNLWLVLSGGLRVNELGSDGNALTTAVLGEGSYFAAGSLVKEGVLVKADAHAIGRTDLAVFELKQLEREFGTDSGVQEHRRLLIYRRFAAFADLYRDVLTAALPQRLARRLLGQALAAGRGGEIELHVTQADLAAMVGASRSRVNVELRRLEARGILNLAYRRIVVHDLAKLRAAAAADVMPL